MIALQVASILAKVIVFFEMSDEKTVDPDEAVEMMEVIGYDIDQFEKGFLRELVDAFPLVALEYEGEAQKLVRNIPWHFYLEETLAEDDPVRLAELEALRDAAD